MATDLLHTMSTNEFHKEIQRHVQDDQRALPDKSKIFAAVAKMQKFDALPEVVSAEELNAYLGEHQGVELNRGLGSTKGVPAPFYARELIGGSMYPGTQSAFGNGIYFATPSERSTELHFPRTSLIAKKHLGTCDAGPGILVRAAIRSNARCMNLER